jgi:ABC-type transporter Mla MlaB component
MLVAVMAERSGHTAQAISPEASRVLYKDHQLSIVQLAPPDTVLLNGDVDITNSQALADALARVSAQWGQVAVDTTGLRFIDVSGWRVLLGPPPAPRARPRLLTIAPCVDRLTQRMITI